MMDANSAALVKPTPPAGGAIVAHEGSCADSVELANEELGTDGRGLDEGSCGDAGNVPARGLTSSGDSDDKGSEPTTTVQYSRLRCLLVRVLPPCTKVPGRRPCLNDIPGSSSELESGPTKKNTKP